MHRSCSLTVGHITTLTCALPLYLGIHHSGFSEAAIESCAERDLNPRPLNSVQTL